VVGEKLRNGSFQKKKRPGPRPAERWGEKEESKPGRGPFTPISQKKRCARRRSARGRGNSLGSLVDQVVDFKRSEKAGPEREKKNR